MSENFAERLGHLLPEAGGFDRDALLVAAGRATARPNRGWIALAGVLASSQVLTLALLWPSRMSSSSPGEPRPAVMEPTLPLIPLEPSSWRRLQDRAMAADGNLLSPPFEAEFVGEAAPLHAFADFPASLLN